MSDRHAYGSFSEVLESGNFVRCRNDHYPPEGICMRMKEDAGKGYYWIYEKEGVYDIHIQDFTFDRDTDVEFTVWDHLSIFRRISLLAEELDPYRRAEPCCVGTFCGMDRTRYRLLIHKDVPVRSILISIMPAYYMHLLPLQYAGACADVEEAFHSFRTTASAPRLEKLFDEIREWRTGGKAAQIFYDSKVAEAVSLVLESVQQKPEIKRERRISEKDAAGIADAAAYIEHHLPEALREEKLCSIACMSPTKLKACFRQIYGCTVTDYIRTCRIEQAKVLMAQTNLTIGQIAEAVGYSTSSRFAVLFQEETGYRPSEYMGFLKNSRKSRAKGR